MTEDGSKLDESNRRRRMDPYDKALLVAVLVAATMLVGWYVWPLVNTTPSQDRCSFGSVDIERSRALLSIAEDTITRDWSVISEEIRTDNEVGLTSILQDEYVSVLGAAGFSLEASVADRIAVMHALMRAMGANFIGTRPTVQTIDELGIPPEVGVIEYFYVVPNLRWLIFDPFARFSLLRATLFLQDNTYAREFGMSPGEVLLFVQIGHFYDPADVSRPPGLQPACPPAPSERWQTDFEATIDAPTLP